MTRRRAARYAGLASAAVAAAWLLVAALPRRNGAAPPARGNAAAPESTGERKIRATLFYVAEDGLRLVGVTREVPYAEDVAGQAQRLVEAQLASPPAPLVSAIPAGTSLRHLFLSEEGDAYLDLSGIVVTGHTGGSLDELLAVYTLVNAVTVNLPAVQAVQILVDGREVDTLAGHIDLRRPLKKNLAWVAEPETPASTEAGRAGPSR